METKRVTGQRETETDREAKRGKKEKLRKTGERNRFGDKESDWTERNRNRQRSKERKKEKQISNGERMREKQI